MEDYESALEALYSPLHQARTPEALKQTALRRTKTIQDMHEYMRRIELFPSNLPPNIVHITGTKGKGSTACMCEAILRERYNLNTGLFTSPHLVDIRERLRINGQPVSKQVFAQAYWTVRKRLEAYMDDSSGDDDLPRLPGYFRMLTLMAFYVFANYEPTIDVVILEVGMGGRYDATNILNMDSSRNVVCGITLLDLDHTRVLGHTMEQIAWEKGGIFQIEKGSLEVSERPSGNQQDEVTTASPTTSENDSSKRFFVLDTNTPSALSVLRRCAAIEGKGNKLHLVSARQSLPDDITLGLPGDHQRINAELAIALCESLIQGMSSTARRDHGQEALNRSLQNSSWPGRCQSVNLTANDGTPLYLRLDGAHTPKSLAACLEWYSSIQGACESYRVLIFNCSHERSPVELLQQLSSCRPEFDVVYFCRADFERPSMVGKATARELLEAQGMEVSQHDDREAQTWQETLASVWAHLEKTSLSRPAKITSHMNVRDAFDEIKTISGYERVEMLVTGSLYIVGSALDAVEWSEVAASGSLKESSFTT